jgi:hypothetical protein
MAVHRGVDLAVGCLVLVRFVVVFLLVVYLVVVRLVVVPLMEERLVVVPLCNDFVGVLAERLVEVVAICLDVVLEVDLAVVLIIVVME